MSDSQAFAVIANIAFASPTRVLYSSWCPDKDLLALVVRVVNKDRISLWKMQGSKIWEVEVDVDAADVASSAETSIVGVAWSPDNLHIAVAHDPPLVTLHSIQDGREERRLSVSSSNQALQRIWWLKELRTEKKPGIPDVFKRQNIITGSAHSILKTQPLLDALPDDSERLSAADLFAFQSTRKTSYTSTLPPSIASWPTLPPNPLLASIQPHSTTASKAKRPGEELDEVDDSNVNSILFVSTSSKGEDRPQLYAWLDGSYPLGGVTLPHPVNSTIDIQKLDNATYLVESQLCLSSGSPEETALVPAKLQLTSIPRDVAQTASSTRALVWYTMRLIKEMREAWFGNAAHNGAREIGPNWVRTLERKQVTAFGAEDPNAVLDLTTLLATGRASESLTDYLGSGDQMTERGIQKWETTVAEALLKLRDYSSRRVAPAFQRIHVLLQEVQGWAQLPQYTQCHFKLDEINIALDLAARGIICANWLAATARKEVQRFKEFIVWVKYEGQRATNLNNDTYTAPPPKHDILDVNAYLTSGLVVSTVDKWFMGPVPRFPLKPGFGVPRTVLGGETLPVDDEMKMGEAAGSTKTSKLDEALRRARGKLSQGKKAFPWPPPTLSLSEIVPGHMDVPTDILPYDLSSVDRNLDALVQDLASRCSAIFKEASGAVARAASLSGFVEPRKLSAQSTRKVTSTKERCTVEGKSMVQHLAMIVPHEEGEARQFLILVKATHDTTSGDVELGSEVFDCTIQQQDRDDVDGPTPVDLLDAEFFDDMLLVLVYRIHDRDIARTNIATLRYSDLEYRLWSENITTRERLADDIIARISSGIMVAHPLPTHQARALVGCRQGSVRMAVNGRVGRRVACVLGEEGMSLEVFDMEGDEEDEGDIAEEE